MPHYANDSRGSGVKHDSHEDALANELEKVGFTEIVQEGIRQTRPSKKNPNGGTATAYTFPKLKKMALLKASDSANRQEEIAKLVPGMKPGTYIKQPVSKQSFPDFLVCDFDGIFFLIEAKSGKGGKTPTMNDNVPKANCIYILSSGVYNENTFFLGHDVILPEAAKMLIAEHKRLQQEAREFNKRLAQMDVYNTGFELYLRPKIQQRQGRTPKGEIRIERTDFFKHCNRLQRETNVLNFALGK